MTMESAEGLLKLRLAEDKANEFVAAIDVRRARSGGITPLASHEPLRRNAGEQDDVQAVELPLPPLPDFSQMPPEVVEVKPTTAAGRIDRWQRKLLDLSLRNRVLNFSRKSPSLSCARMSPTWKTGSQAGLLSASFPCPHRTRWASAIRRFTAMFMAATFSESLRRNPCSGTNWYRRLNQKSLKHG